MSGQLIEQARRLAGLTQADLAELAGTSRPTLSAYESGKKSPTLSTAERILNVAGFALSLDPAIEFTEHTTNMGRPFYVANRLWRIPIEKALATVELPLHLNWSSRGEKFNLSDRRQRMHCYETVLREGDGRDILTYVDGALLADLWSEIYTVREIKKAWNPIIEESRR